MKRTITLMSVVLSMTTVASLSAQKLQSRKANLNPRDAGVEIRVVNGPSVLREGSHPSESMGKLTLFHREDFSLMTAGTEAKPDTVGTICAPDGTYKYRMWQNIDPKYTHWRGWGGSFKDLTFEECKGKGYTHAAGGTIHLGSKEGAKLNTPPLDLKNVILHEEEPNSDNIIVLRFKAKVTQEIDPKLCAVRLFVEAAETSWYCDSDFPTYKGSWDVLRKLTPEITTLSKEWNTYEMTFAGAGHSTIVNMGFMVMPKSREIAETGDFHFDILFDDVEIFKMKPNLPIPKVTPHTSFTGDSFVANWEAVEGADRYFIDVYCMQPDPMYPPNPMGQQPMVRKDVIVGQEVKGTSYKVTGVEPQYTYYYNVRAAKGTKESYHSVDQAVNGLAKPELKDVSELTAGRYVASWSGVPSAGRYTYMAYHDRRVYQDAEITIIDEDFTGVKDLEGNSTGWSVDNHPSGSYSRAFPKDLHMPGWEMYSYSPCTDYVGFDGWQYINHGVSASMQSPELDLSHGGGVVNVSMSLYSAYAKQSNQFPQAALALFNYNEETERYEQADLVYPAEENEMPIINRWQDYRVQLKNGSKRSIIALFAVKGPEYLFVDNFKVTQNFKKGESYLAPYFGEPLCDGTTIDVNVPEEVQGDALYHRVKAIKATDRDLISSDFTKMGLVRNVTANTPLVLTEPTARLANGVLSISNPNGDAVYVYDVMGQIVYRNDLGDREIEVALPVEDAYIVRIGHVVSKVI